MTAFTPREAHVRPAHGIGGFAVHRASSGVEIEAVLGGGVAGGANGSARVPR
jgi:hypothetical protein